MLNLESAKAAIEAEIEHADKAIAHFYARVEVLERTLLQLSGLDRGGAVAKSAKSPLPKRSLDKPVKMKLSVIAPQLTNSARNGENMSRWAACLLVLCVVTFPQFVWAENVIRVQFVERPPYIQQMKDGSARGLIATPVEQLFKTAGMSVVWDRTSVNRQWKSLQNSTEMTCAISWYKTPEREKIAKFTNAIYRDIPVVLLARTQFSIPSNQTLEAVLATKGVRVLFKGNYSYGARIDGLLKKYQPIIVYTDSEYLQMPLMLRGNRADFMFETKEEAEYLMASTDTSSFLHILTPKNVRTGERPYIACNKSVPDEIMERLNGAIKLK